jgi:hypothetical protein
VARKPVHQITMSRQELAALSRPRGALAAPLSAAQLEEKLAREREEMRRLIAGEGPKAKRERKDLEHSAQRRLYETLLPSAESRYPEHAHMLRAVYAIPVFNANLSGAKAAIIGARFKAEGQKAGSPDNHVPVPMLIGGVVYGSLYLELKAESYPNAAQRERFPQLAACGNAVVTIREAEPKELAEQALWTIVRYLMGKADFHTFGHPSHTYVHNTVHPLAFYKDSSRGAE